jgi:L-arabinose isomerase
MKPQNEIKIALIGVGLDTYWGQFEGLLQRLTGYRTEIGERMSSLDGQVIDANVFKTQ